jgi:purine-binding chemotaxis protein CheW
LIAEACAKREKTMADEQLWDEDGENTQADKYLLFNLGAEVYGIPITHVINIIELQKITEVPDMPVYIRGVINLRGSVIPVMDLRLRFRLPERPYDDRTCIIIVRVAEKSVGFICDTVAEVNDIAPRDIEEPLQFKRDQDQAQYISGLGKVGNDVRILLDVEKVLSDDDQRVLAG